LTKTELIKECVSIDGASDIILYKAYQSSPVKSEDGDTYHNTCTLAVAFFDPETKCRKLINCLEFDNFLNLAEGQAFSKVVKIRDIYFNAVQFTEDYEGVRLIIKKDAELAKFEETRGVNKAEPLGFADIEEDFIEEMSKDIDNVTIAIIKCSSMSEAVNHIILS